MSIEEFNEIIEKRISLIKRTLAQKSKEYSTDDDKFHNFKSSVGMSFHKAPEKIAWEFMTKHLQSIKDMLEHVEIDGYNGHPSESHIDEKIGDAINYLILIEGMLKERIKYGKKY